MQYQLKDSTGHKIPTEDSFIRSKLTKNTYERGGV
jgi:hypothetical protein